MTDNDLEFADGEGLAAESGLIAGGMAFVGTGVAVGVTLISRKKGGALAYLIPGALIALGLSLLGAAAAGRYGAHVDQAEQAVREQLDQLDPFARIKILKDLASEQVPEWVKRGQDEPAS